MIPFSSLADLLISRLGAALMPFSHGDSYLFWPYALSTLALALVFGRAAFFNRALWWNGSARQDYALYLLNFVLVPALTAVLAFNENTVVSTLNQVFIGSASQGGRLASIDPTAWPTRVAFTIVVFVVYDFGRFFAHWLLHRVPMLWELHKVHHSALVLTPFTSYRVHPLEPIFINTVCMVLTGALVWLSNRFVSTGISVYLFLGTHVLLAAFNFVDNLKHSPVWLSYGPVLNRWLISPAHHQLHHSMEDRHMGCNLGSSLAIWDRVNGSLCVPASRKESFRLGLPDADPSPHEGLWSLYIQPLLLAWRQLTQWVYR